MKIIKLLKILFSIVIAILFTSYFIESYNCDIYSCNIEDYNDASFSNPERNGTASNGEDVRWYGWEIYNYVSPPHYGYTTYYNGTYYNTTPLSIKVDMNINGETYNHYWPLHTHNGTFNANCVDFMFTELATPGVDKGHNFAFKNETQTPFFQHGINCQNDVLGVACYKCSTSWIDYTSKFNTNVWYSFCAYWNGTYTLFSIFNGTTNIENMTTGCSKFNSDPFVSGNWWYSGSYIGNYYVDNYREFNGSLGELGILIGDTTLPIITILYPSQNQVIFENVYINVSINESGICALNNTYFSLNYSNSTYFSFFRN